jgi:hypothetical protein
MLKWKREILLKKGFSERVQNSKFGQPALGGIDASDSESCTFVHFSRSDLQDLHSFAPLQIRSFVKEKCSLVEIWLKFANILNIS